MSATRPQAVAATDGGAGTAGIARVKSAKSIRRQVGNWLTLRQAQALLNAPDITSGNGCATRHHRRAARLRDAPVGGDGAHRRALVGRMHAGGDGCRTARGYAGAVGAVLAALVLDTIRMSAIRARRSRRRTAGCWRRNCLPARLARDAPAMLHGL